MFSLFLHRFNLLFMSTVLALSKEACCDLFKDVSSVRFYIDSNALMNVSLCYRNIEESIRSQF